MLEFTPVYYIAPALIILYAYTRSFSVCMKMLWVLQRWKKLKRYAESSVNLTKSQETDT